MEEVYAALLLHKAGKQINETNLKRVLDSAGINVEESKVKALVASLDGVDIEAAIKEAAIAPVSTSAPSQQTATHEKKEAVEEKKSSEEAAAGLSSLFG